MSWRKTNSKQAVKRGTCTVTVGEDGQLLRVSFSDSTWVMCKGGRITCDNRTDGEFEQMFFTKESGE